MNFIRFGHNKAYIVSEKMDKDFYMSEIAKYLIGFRVRVTILRNIYLLCDTKMYYLKEQWISKLLEKQVHFKISCYFSRLKKHQTKHQYRRRNKQIINSLKHNILLINTIFGYIHDMVLLIWGIKFFRKHNNKTRGFCKLFQRYITIIKTIIFHTYCTFYGLGAIGLYIHILVNRFMSVSGVLKRNQIIIAFGKLEIETIKYCWGLFTNSIQIKENNWLIPASQIEYLN